MRQRYVETEKLSEINRNKPRLYIYIWHNAHNNKHDTVTIATKVDKIGNNTTIIIIITIIKKMAVNVLKQDQNW